MEGRSFIDDQTGGPQSLVVEKNEQDCLSGRQNRSLLSQGEWALPPPSLHLECSVMLILWGNMQLQSSGCSSVDGEVLRWMTEVIMW